MDSLNKTKIGSLALVHDWLFGLRGGERCLQAFLCMYEKADVHALFYKKGKVGELIDTHFRSASIVNSISGIEKFYRLFLPLFPILSSNPLLANYKVRISLSHAASKNIRGTPAGEPHICYCFTPMRYIWDQASRYLGWKSVVALPLIYSLRFWDKRGARGVTDFVSISSFVAARIRKYYGRKSKVIFPPVTTTWLNPEKACRPDLIQIDEKAYLFAGALVPYKGAELAIRACTELDRNLWVAGTGPEIDKLKQIAGKNIKFLGKVSDSELSYLLNNCRALIFPCKEDFGILPLEAQAAGKAVIALFAGACKQTILGFRPWLKQPEKPELASESHTGVFIRNANAKELLNEVIMAIEFFERNEAIFNSENCKNQARKFSPGCFYDSWREFAIRTPGLSEVPMVDKGEFVLRFDKLREGIF